MVCGHLPDGNRFAMENNFSKENFHTFVSKFMTSSLQPFLFSGLTSSTSFESPLTQINAYELIQVIEEEEDKVILLLSEENELSITFQKAASLLSNDISFVWMSLNENEVAPNLSNIFKTMNTSIYIKTNGTVIKFIPVATERNLLNLLTKSSNQRKLHVAFSL